MSPVAITAATGRFSAARRVDILPEDHPCRRPHGHNFQATVFAALPEAWAPFPGGEVEGLAAPLEECLHALRFRDLNSLLEHPTDENLARWVWQRTAAPGIVRVAVQSTPHQGVDLDATGLAHVWRRYEFQAAHRLPHVPLGHRCGRMHGHGFEVILHANVALGQGDISMDYDRLDQIWAPLQLQLDFSCLNEIEGLRNPTSENISAWLWARLKPELPALSWVTVFETASCGANFDGSNYRIWKDFTLDSAVRLRRAPDGAGAARIHGHTYKLRLHLKAPLDALLGWTIDFGDVKEIFDPTFRALDHQPLYEIAGLTDTDTASIAAWIYQNAGAKLPQLCAVELFERAGCGSLVSADRGGPLLPV